MTRTLAKAASLPLLIALLLAAFAVGIGPCGEDEDPIAEVDNINGLTTSVALDRGFVKALGDLRLTPAPVGIGEIKKNGTAIFPITDGNIEYYDPAGDVRPFVQGELTHNGSGLSLTGGETEVKLTDFVIDPGESTLKGRVTVNGEEAEGDALLFNLDGTTLKPLKLNKKKGVAVLKGTTVELSQDAADLLNETFGDDALEGGIVIGVSTIKVNTG